MRRVLCLADVDVVAREDDHARVGFGCVAAVVVVVMRAKSWTRALASRSVVVVFVLCRLTKRFHPPRARNGRVAFVWYGVLWYVWRISYVISQIKSKL